MFVAIAKLLKKIGGQGRNRTADAGLFRAALYQLSYLASLSEDGEYREFLKELSTLTIITRICLNHHKKSLTGFLRGV
jgi:hypothetical protein